MFFGRASDPSVINEAVAYPSQSDTAEAIIAAMLNVWNKNMPVHILNQVHDSLLFQVDENACDELTPEILKVAEDRLILKKGREFLVPNEAKTGWNMGDVIYNKDGSKTNPLGLSNWSADGDKRTPPKRKKYISILDR